MSDAAARAQRALAVEERRRRLEELKKNRERRSEDTARVQASSNLDEYIDGLLGEPNASGSEAPTTTAAAAPAVAQSVSIDNGDTASNPEAQPVSNVIAEAAPAPAPKMVETFTVSTQTEDCEFLSNDADDTEPQEIVETKEEPDIVEQSIEKEKDPKLLSSEEVEKEISSQPFSSFINSASKKVERMLGTPLLSDLLVDYVGEKDDARTQQKDTQDKFVQTRQVYECSKWTAGRDVTDMDWSPLHRELLLSTMASSAGKGTAVKALSHNDTSSASITPRSGELQSDGLALIWSLAMPARPEHIFTCGSPVMCGRFHPTEPTLVLGGCESGQLVVWDIRSGRLPVQKSALTTITGATSKGHMHPINSMQIIEGGSGLTTTSTDGKVNFWSLGNLREPAETLQVGESVSCFSIAAESEALLLGDEHGSMYTVLSQSSTGGQQRSNRRQVKKLETADDEGENFGHYGMITSLSTKSLKKGASIRAAGLSRGFLRGSGGLVLSSGVDWTVKLWAPAYSDRPLVSFVSHSYDYMSDVAWSPTHPSLFATASSNGTVGLWNLASSFEEPVTGQDGIVVEPDAVSGRGLNKLKWSSDGRRMAAASADRVHVLSLSEEIVRTKGDEDSKVMNQLLARGMVERQ